VPHATANNAITHENNNIFVLIVPNP